MGEILKPGGKCFNNSDAVCFIALYIHSSLRSGEIDWNYCLDGFNFPSVRGGEGGGNCK